MATKYLILRANKDLEPDLNFTKPSAWKSTTGAPTDLAIETVDGHERDAGELRADPKNAAVVDAEVVLSLIQPKAKSVANLASLQQMGALKMTGGLVAIGAHTSPFTGQGVTVAVLDTGIDDTHPAFAGKQLAKRDFTGEGVAPDDVRDTEGHGTHCAATVCGAPGDGMRVGVAPGVTKLCVGKVLGAQGGSLEMLLKGMFWAVLDEKAAVVSMSLGYDLPGNVKRLIAKFGMDPALATNAALRQQGDILRGISTLRAFLESQSQNALFAAATGNESERPQFVLDASLPAAELFSVGAVGSNGNNKWKVANFSNARAHVVAPGVDVVSAAAGGGWATMSGTSMATPHVAGVAALWVEKLRNSGGLSVPEAVRAALKASTTKQPLVDTDVTAIGSGMVQAPQ